MASKKDKIRKLFENTKISRNKSSEYSSLINAFIIPFQDDFPKDWGVEYILHFTVNAWNLGNLRVIVPREEFDYIIALKPGEDAGGIDIELLKRMIDYKVSRYKEYDRFITEFKFSEPDEETRQSVLVVQTADRDTYANIKQHDTYGQPEDDDFAENYIDRYAVVIKPQQPFLDWINSFISEGKVEQIEEAHIYLIDDTIEDLSQWLKKRFDTLFVMELNYWHPKRYWPKKRTYKIFRQWFRVDVSAMIYDMERIPILKEGK
ncbi:hypothetical protein [Sinomicrobium sp. M5D2P17]